MTRYLGYYSLVYLREANQALVLPGYVCLPLYPPLFLRRVMKSPPARLSSAKDNT